jgi:ATP-binding cassette subfamily B (MDR/TAP) protein 1
MAGITLSNHMREQYLSAVLVQDQAFFDRVGPGEIVSRANTDIDAIRIGLGERLGYLVWTSSTITTVRVPLYLYTRVDLYPRHSSLPLYTRHASLRSSWL